MEKKCFAGLKLFAFFSSFKMQRIGGQEKNKQLLTIKGLRIAENKNCEITKFYGYWENIDSYL